MEGRIGHRPGGIRELLALVRGEHGLAIESDLIDRGLRLAWLGDEDIGRLSWRDLKIILENLDHRSAFYRSVQGNDWSPEMWGLAALYDAIALNSYVLLRVNGNKPAKPTPYPRPKNSSGPGSASDDDAGTTKYGVAIDIDQFEAWLENRKATGRL